MVKAFPVFGQAAAAVEPTGGRLDDPSLGQHDELASVASSEPVNDNETASLRD